MGIDTAIKIGVIGLEAFVFCVFVGLFFSLSNRFATNEEYIQRDLDYKQGITSSIDDVGTVSEITGAAVISEIKAYNGNCYIYINNLLINSLPTDTNQSYLEYAREYGYEELERLVLAKRSYKKIVSLDSNGNTANIQYILQ